MGGGAWRTGCAIKAPRTLGESCKPCEFARPCRSTENKETRPGCAATSGTPETGKEETDKRIGNGKTVRFQDPDQTVYGRQDKRKLECSR